MGTLSRALLILTLQLSPVLACPEIRETREKNPTWSFVEIRGEDMERFVANYNAREPVTDHHPDQVWVAYDRSENSVYVSMIFAGCVKFQDEMPVEEFTEMLLEPKNPV